MDKNKVIVTDPEEIRMRYLSEKELKITVKTKFSKLQENTEK